MPEIPLKRLSSLLQQSLKWQCHTGTFPTVQRMFQPATEDEHEAKLEGEGHQGDKDGDNKKKKKRKAKVDLVLGNVDITSSGDGKKKQKAKDGTTSISSSIVERIPSRVHQSIRLG